MQTSTLQSDLERVLKCLAVNGWVFSCSIIKPLLSPTSIVKKTIYQFIRKREVEINCSYGDVILDKLRI